MTAAQRLNQYGQPIGPALDGWTARPRPPRTPMKGRTCTVEPVDVGRHAADLHRAYAGAADGRDWTYLSAGPFATQGDYVEYLSAAAASADPFHHAVIDHRTGKAIATLALMRIDPPNGVIEVGHVTYSPLIQRTVMGTEAQFLLMRRAFDELGYRRYEWKCDAFNAPSRRAALRYGFRFEGVFRQAVVTRGRSRDTAWYSILDSEWAQLRPAYERWLAATNFDEQGRQRATLSSLIEAAH